MGMVHKGGNAVPFHGDHHPVKVATHRKSRNLLQTGIIPSKTTNGVTYSRNDDGSITVNGTATNTAYFNLDFGGDISSAVNYWTGYIGKKITVSGGNYGVGLTCGLFTEDGQSKNICSSESGNAATATVPGYAYKMRCYLFVRSSTTVDNVTIYPQVELGSIATEYEPYGLIEEPIFEPIDQAHDGKTLTFENTYNDAAEVTVFGESTQEGEPTPEAPVPIESIKSVELVSSNEDGSKSATRTIDLQGHELRSLPDGTRDELVVHRDGTVELVQMVYQVMMHDMLWNRMPVVEYPNGYVFYAYDFILPQRIKHNAFASSDYVNSGAGTYYRTMKHNYMVCGNGGTGTSCWLRNDDYTEVVDLEASLGDATLDYPLATPQTIQLPSIDPLPTYHQYTFVDGNGADISARVRVFE